MKSILDVLISANNIIIIYLFFFILLFNYFLYFLKILTYVSTAYCNMDKPIIEEIVYPSPAKWQEMIALCEETDPSQINYICNKLLQNFPNTYVFAKALSEHVVNDMCKDKIPTLILRPSIGKILLHLLLFNTLLIF